MARIVLLCLFRRHPVDVCQTFLLDAKLVRSLKVAIDYFVKKISAIFSVGMALALLNMRYRD